MARILRVIGTHSQRLHYALYAKNDIKSLRDLYGRSFGISGIGGLPHLVILALMDRQALDPSKLSMLTVGGTGARLTALAAGKIDATLGEYSPVIEAQPGIRRLMVVSPELPLYMAQGVVVWSNVLASKRDALERMQRGLVNATRWAYDNKSELIEVARKHLPLTAEEMGKVYDFYTLARSLGDQWRARSCIAGLHAGAWNQDQDPEWKHRSQQARRPRSGQEDRQLAGHSRLSAAALTNRVRELM